VKRDQVATVKGRRKESSRVLASEIAYDNHKFSLRDFDSDSVEQSKGYLQHTTACADLNTVALRHQSYTGLGTSQKGWRSWPFVDRAEN